MARSEGKDSVVGVSGKGDAGAPTTQTGSTSPADSVVSKAKADIKKRGRPSDKDRLKATEADNARLVAELEKIFAPEHWEALVRAPADLRLAQTGYKHWEMSDNEVKMLAASASNTARYFMRTDPKWIVLTLFLFNVGTIYGGRVLMDYNIRKKEAELQSGADTGRPKPTDAARPQSH